VGRQSNSAQKGCLGAAAVLAGVWLVIVWIVEAIVAFFSTPVPYVLLVGAAGTYFSLRVRRDRLAKLYWDVVGNTQRPNAWAPDVADQLWRRGQDEPDVLLLRSAVLAGRGDIDGAIEYVEAATRKRALIGRLSGAVWLYFPRQVESIEFGSSNPDANLNLVRGHLEVLRGNASGALRWLHTRLHEPHYAAALLSLAEAHGLEGAPARAAGFLRAGLVRVYEPEVRQRLRHRLGSFLESLGAYAEAAAEFRALTMEGTQTDAPARYAQLEARLRDDRARQTAERDNAILFRTLAELEAARGPRSRDNALSSGLAQLVQPHMREQLLLEASRIEVRSVLDKVAGLKTKSAKLRNLHEALARISIDDIPDQLQAAEIAELERAVAQVEAS
jgi:hypothetical protein